MSPRLAELLDEMIFSADIEGFIKRKSKELVNDEFLDFLRQKLSASDDDDEKVIITDTIALITERQRLQDGLGDQVNIVFETRLDQILFKSPNMRLKWIEENAEDITPGFVEFVQNELRKNTDIDNKVDFAFCCNIIINMNLFAGGNRIYFANDWSSERPRFPGSRSHLIATSGFQSRRAVRSK